MAQVAGFPLILKREGGNHSIYTLNGKMIVIPRHREINELTAKSILASAKDAATPPDNGTNKT